MRKFILLLCIVSFIFLFYSQHMIVFALQTDDYKVGNLDILRISVEGKAGINDLFPVSSDGSINFPLLGNVSVSGLTAKEIEQKITGLLGKDYLIDPKVYVSMEKYNSQKVIAWGEVKSPGTYILTGRITLLEIIAQAGGITDKASKRVMLFRDQKDDVQGNDMLEVVKGAISKKDPLIIHIDQLTKGGGLARDLIVAAGDVIVVEAQKDFDINEQQVYITGCLNKPGAYAYQNGLTALSLCIIAGGFTNRAATHKTTLVRKIEGEDKVYEIDLDKIKRGKSVDFKLIPGDRLNVPESFF